MNEYQIDSLKVAVSGFIMGAAVMLLVFAILASQGVCSQV